MKNSTIETPEAYVTPYRTAWYLHADEIFPIE
jgi:hypothetical protein